MLLHKIKKYATQTIEFQLPSILRHQPISPNLVQPNDINHLRHQRPNKIRIRLKMRTKKSVQKHKKSHQNRLKSQKIVKNHIKIVRYPPAFYSSTNIPLPIMECGGKRSATPLWMPISPRSKMQFGNEGETSSTGTRRLLFGRNNGYNVQKGPCFRRLIFAKNGRPVKSIGRNPL